MVTRKLATVFGGAGFIGRQVVQRLARLDYVVRVVGRNPDAMRVLMTAGKVGQVVPLAADLHQDAALARAVAEADVVVNLVGILAERKRGDFRRLQGELPGRIGQAAAAAGVWRMVHVSAIGADPDSPSEYARSKAAGEAALRAAFPRATILRPSIVFGPDDQFFNRFAAMAQLLPFMPVIRGRTRFQPVYVGDVADAVLAALASDAAEGRTYELGGPRVASFHELMALVLDATGRRKRLVDMPDWLVRLMAHLPGGPLTTDQLAQLGRDNVVSAGAPGLQDLGITPKAMEAVVPSYLATFRKGGGRRNPALDTKSGSDVYPGVQQK
ncbi:complex I NDUFA9 subunit family protein [Roseomonas marmotae]|uniref:Complex I NDUFA9 subunit family protein n=1 Tax=Roseomonas marmotae TaxID=2768161 RepID=A0ABS3K8D8_9PROT|nr:complex I NDUFA9 subunit family protein [Roseomonas marmotae]MBO1073190.1 complex I NDUFA9 subunit family protein [Roseomonas marmotae]QTI79179.1 complex I NDUFA9 subunit family protein [Roseomonas marmotae]